MNKRERAAEDRRLAKLVKEHNAQIEIARTGHIVEMCKILKIDEAFMNKMIAAVKDQNIGAAITHSKLFQLNDSIQFLNKLLEG